MTTQGRIWLSKLEGGHRLKAYLDTRGIWTIGVGVTRWPFSDNPVAETDRIKSVEISDRLFSEVLREYDEAVFDALVKDGSMIRGGFMAAGNVFDAFVSFCYNVGIAGFTGSTALKRFNSGFPLSSVAEAMRWWNKPSEIIERRNCEVDCLTRGIYRIQGQKDLTSLRIV